MQVSPAKNPFAPWADGLFVTLREVGPYTTHRAPFTIALLICTSIHATEQNLAVFEKQPPPLHSPLLFDIIEKTFPKGVGREKNISGIARFAFLSASLLGGRAAP